MSLNSLNKGGVEKVSNLFKLNKDILKAEERLGFLKSEKERAEIELAEFLLPGDAKIDTEYCFWINSDFVDPNLGTARDTLVKITLRTSSIKTGFFHGTKIRPEIVFSTNVINRYSFKKAEENKVIGAASSLPDDDK